MTTAEKLTAHATTAEQILRHHRDLVYPDQPMPMDEPIIYPRAFPLVEVRADGQRVIVLRRGEAPITVADVDRWRSEAEAAAQEAADLKERLNSVTTKN